MSTEPGSDPIGDFQRWLMKAGAKSIGREVAGRVKSTFGGGAGAKDPDDVWDTATTEEPTDEPPECQWCPICRAARRYRDSGGAAAGAGQFAGVGDTLAGLTRDAFSLFDAALRQAQRPAPPSGVRPAEQEPSGHGPSGHEPADHGHSDHGAVVVGPGVGWPTVVHAEHEDDEAADEGGDRQEGGEPGDGGANGGTDQQVEGTAE
ncbi:MAG: hypothetical protein QOG28_4000 [Trebonia sp.]|jgi:hypothetical protein|nr:hypothetical protein [Actinomycetes bacterium]MDX6419380.1 hypothetical protein [Trebonia sp.]